MEFVYPAGQDAADYVRWREQVEFQKRGYEVAGVRPEVKTCGTVPVLKGPGGGQVGMSVVGKGLRISGMWRCGNRWCPECRAKVAHHRSAEVEQAVGWASGNGLIVVMYTLTGSHFTDEEVESAGGSWHEAAQAVTAKMVRQRMSAAWRRATTGKRNKMLREGRVGTITAQEVTLDDVMVSGSRTGLHWHRHMLAFLEPQAGLSAEEVAGEYGNLLFEYWQAGVESVGLVADRKGFDVKVAGTPEEAEHLAGYVSKGEGALVSPAEAYAKDGRIHLEMTRAEGKSGRGEGRVSPEQVLRNIGYLKGVEPEGNRLRRLMAQWRDLEEGAKGVHWLRWSPDLRAMVGLDVEEMTDEEVANTEVEAASEHVVVVSWGELREHVEELRRVIRESVDGEEFGTLLVCLDSLGVEYHLETSEEWQGRLSARMASMRVGAGG